VSLLKDLLQLFDYKSDAPPSWKTVALIPDDGNVVMTDSSIAKILSPIDIAVGDRVLVYQDQILKFKWSDMRQYIPIPVLPAPATPQSLWISDWAHPYAQSYPVSTDVLNFSLSGYFQLTMINPSKLATYPVYPGVQGSPNIPINTNTDGIAIDENNNLYVGLYDFGVVFKVDPTTGLFRAAKHVPQTQPYNGDLNSILAMRAGNNRIYAIGLGNLYEGNSLFVWDADLTYQIMQVAPGLPTYGGNPIPNSSFFTSLPEQPNDATALDYYNGVLYVAWEFIEMIDGVPTSTCGVAIHDADTGVFKSWAFYSEAIGALNDIFFHNGTLYGTDDTHKQIITYTLGDSDIYMYSVNQWLPNLPNGAVYNPLAIVVDNSGNIYFTAMPEHPGDHSYDFSGPAWLVKLNPDFSLNYIAGEKAPSGGITPQNVTEVMLIAPYYMALQGRT
jgi:hypothetical protein